MIYIYNDIIYLKNGMIILANKNDIIIKNNKYECYFGGSSGGSSN
jgi:hypothetical protein